MGLQAALVLATFLLCVVPTTTALTASISCPAARYPSIQTGSAQTFSTVIKLSAADSAAIVSFEIYNASGSKIFQTFQSPVSLSANVNKTVSASWSIPASQRLGTYSVKVLVFGPNWTPLYGARSACVSFAVVAPTTAPPTTKPPTTAPPPPTAVTVQISCSSASSVLAGQSIALSTALVASSNIANAIVSFELYNSSSSKVYQTYKSSITLSAGVSQAVSASWAVPASQASGTYSVKILVFGEGWTPLYAVRSSCAVFTVAKSSTAPPTTKPPTTAPPTTKAPTTPPSTTSSKHPSGEPMPIGDLPGWTQIFKDDFVTPAPVGSFLSTYPTWSAYPDGWKDTSKHGVYTPSKVLSVTSSGLFNLYLHTENNIHLVSAPYPKLPKPMLYGRYVVRFRADSLPGYKTAWLLWPDSGVWPRDGEIDFPEGNLDSTIAGFMHRMNGTSGSDQDYFLTGKTYTTWHTATIEWLPNNLTFTLDGVSKSFTRRVPSTPMHWVIQTETALTSTPPSSSVAGNVQIDWVAVYRPTAALLQRADQSPSKGSSFQWWWIVTAAVVGCVLLVAAVAVVIVMKKRAGHQVEQDTAEYALMQQ